MCYKLNNIYNGELMQQSVRAEWNCRFERERAVNHPASSLFVGKRKILLKIPLHHKSDGDAAANIFSALKI